MFETSVVRDHAAAVPRRAGVLSVSLVAHAVVILGAVTMGIASVDFPRSAPDQFAPFQQVAALAVPPQLGDPNGGARPAAQPEKPKPAPAPVPDQVTAPSTVPETVTPVDSSSSSSASEADGTPGATSTAPIGVPWGDPNSVSTDLDLPPAIVAAPPAVEDKIYAVAGEVRSPMLIHRVEPKFPPALARIRMNATIRVRCVIDKQGNVRDPQVLLGSMPPFNQAVVDAVRLWRFKPATLRGQPVDAWLELTVNFTVR